MQYSLHQIQVALDGVIRNFPLKPLRWILRLIVFPTGQRYRVPDDRLGHRVASILLTPGETRDRLTEGVFQSTDPNDPVGAVEYALAKTLESEPIEKRLRKQGQARRYDEDYDVWVKQHVETGIIDNAEAEILIEAQRAIRQAIMVDDFEQDSVAAKIHQDKAA
jgi:acyl-CoA dehydrogenase